MMSFVNEDKADFVRKWCIKADHDFQAARNERSMKDQEILTDTICYHCHQTVEKYLKAFLVWHEVDFKKVHDLVYLQGLCAGIDDELSVLKLTNLTNYGTAVRYPDDFYMPSIEETDQALRIANQVRELVRFKLAYVLQD